MHASLPPACHIVIESPAVPDSPGSFRLGVGLVKLGEPGYTLVYDYTREITLGYDYALGLVRSFVTSHNRYMGITEAQERACYVGALHGWDRFGARPQTWEIAMERVGVPISVLIGR